MVKAQNRLNLLVYIITVYILYCDKNLNLKIIRIIYVLDLRRMVEW